MTWNNTKKKSHHNQDVGNAGKANHAEIGSGIA